VIAISENRSLTADNSTKQMVAGLGDALRLKMKIGLNLVLSKTKTERGHFSYLFFYDELIAMK
jgi:hypothetical protein